MSKIEIATDPTAEFQSPSARNWIFLFFLWLFWQVKKSTGTAWILLRPNSTGRSTNPKSCRYLLRWHRCCIRSCLKKPGKRDIMVIPCDFNASLYTRGNFSAEKRQKGSKPVLTRRIKTFEVCWRLLQGGAPRQNGSPQTTQTAKHTSLEGWCASLFGW